MQDASSSSSAGPREDAEHRDSSSLAGLLTCVSDQRTFGMSCAEGAVLPSAKRSRTAREQIYGLCKTLLISLCLFLA